MTQWFDRTFAFPYPAELLPNLLARLRGTPARLEELVGTALPSALTLKPGGKWSPQEHIGHLLDLESLWFKRVDDFSQDAAILTPTDLQNRQTDAANYNARELAAILSAFREARTRTLGRVAELPAEAFKSAIPHPRLHTPMHLADHLFFVAEHDDHHLAHLYAALASRAPLL